MTTQCGICYKKLRRNEKIVFNYSLSSFTLCNNCNKCNTCKKTITKELNIKYCYCMPKTSITCKDCPSSCGAKICQLDGCNRRIFCKINDKYCNYHKFLCKPNCTIGRRPNKIGDMESQNIISECNCKVSIQDPFQQVLYYIKKK